MKTSTQRHPFRLLILTLLVAGVSVPAAAADPQSQDATLQQLQQQVQTLSQQLQAVQRELQQVQKQQHQAQTAAAPALTTQAASGLPSMPAQTAAASQSGLPSLPAQSSGGSSPWDKLGIFGYGEIYYTHPTHRPDLTQADLARAVFGFSYAFDDRTQFNSEFETEHAVSSASDKGEFEVEQFYIDRQLADWASVKGGLFLIPSGLLNQNHEPTNYYGVQRNFVETLIIPSTWREGGLAFHGDTNFGLNWEIGLTTGFDLSGYDNFPENPQYLTALELEDNDVAPLQQSHQELSLANAQHLSEYVSLNYQGVPGLDVGGSVFTGEAATPQVPAGLPEQRVTLWEGHVRYNPGRLDLSALYARGIITNTSAFNLANAGASSPEPGKFYGWYLQGAYTVWRHGSYRLAPFVRWERYDMGASYSGLGGFPPVPSGTVPGYGVFPQPYDRVWTYGFNFYLNPRIVLKADYQSFRTNSDFTRFDLGLGLTF